MLFWLALAAAGLWLAVLLVPWRPWSTRERLEPNRVSGNAGCERSVSVLIPARNEAATIASTLASVLAQDQVDSVVVVDDQSTDDTAGVVRQVQGANLVEGQATPPGWTGKLWALEQGLARVECSLVLLLDADIRLAPGMLAALVDKLESDELDQVSIMATLPAGSLPEKLMLPAFVYFFKQLYPFAWVNRDDRPFAAAAGGCVLVRRDALQRAGAFAAWKDALIDDCELASRVRAAGGRIWLGLSHGVTSMRRHPDLSSVLDTIRRTAYTQLRHSPVILIAVVVIMLAAFGLPLLALVAGIMQGNGGLVICGLAGWLLMAMGYLPQVRFSRINAAWAFSLPIAAMLFVYATIDSGLRHHFGRGSGWKGRNYSRARE
ncbi:MAG: glycosyltransferase [Wenzhouxiangellaceae bacterium]